MVQQGETMSQNNEIAKIMGWIMKGLGVIGITPNGGFAKLDLRQGCWTPLKGRRQRWKKCNNGCTKLKPIWKLSASKRTRRKFIFLRHSLRSMCGISGCFKNKRHPTYLKPSHGRSSNYSWTKSWCYNIWCWKTRWSFYNSPKEMEQAPWPAMCKTSMECW